MFRFFKKPLIIIVLIGGIGGLVAYAFRDKSVAPELIAVAKGNIVQEVSVTGKVVAVKDIKLAFEKAGRVAAVFKSVGDHVRAGDTIAALDSSELSAQKLEAEANVKAEEATLNELLRGARAEEIQVKETAVLQAQQDLSSLYASAPQVLSDAYNNADDAVRKQIDALFTNDEKVDPTLSFDTSDTQARGRAEAGRVIASQELNAWRTELSSAYVASGQPILDDYLTKARAHLVTLSNFLNDTGDALLAAQQVPADTLAAYKTSLATARTKVTAAITSISDKEQAIATKKIAVTRAENELALEKANATTEQVNNQEARIEQAKASLLSIEAQLAKTLLSSPIEGTITAQEAEVGEIVVANTSLVTVLSENLLQVELFLPEADVAKVKKGNAVKVTLDAYGDSVVFSGTVTMIDPAETVIEGVSTYKTTIQFLKSDERVRPGMTANTDILTAQKEDVLYVPQRSVGVRNGGAYVKVYQEGKEEEREVETGLKGSDGNIEIVSGLAEGESIVRLP